MKNQIGKLIKSARTMRGVSQRELGNRVDLSQTGISGIEMGSNVTVRTVLKILDALGYELHVSLKPKRPKERK
jgi:transcriptional regulator with XRE-family HTH domain